MRRYLRPGVLVGHVLVLAAALICLRLGWWQWSVAHATRGTVQNLGYALLWPVFAGAFIYMWLRFLHLESVRESELAELAERQLDETGPSAADLPDGPQPRAGTGPDGRVTDGGVTQAPHPAASTEAGTAVAPGTGASTVPDAGAPAPSGAGWVGSSEVDATAEEGGSDGSAGHKSPRPRRGRPNPHETYTIAVATVGGDDDDDDDPELAAYNRALAALAEQDERRAR